MSSHDRYAIPADSDWTVSGGVENVYALDYEDTRPELLNLYRKGKNLQWDSETRIDWSQDLDPENPEGMPDESIPIFAWDGFAKLTAQEKSRVRHHFQAWQLSQFLHGEQGALLCTAKIVQTVPGIDAKFYAATQVIDEARHVESYSRLLHEKFELAYPVNKSLKTLLDQTLSDSRWDMTYLGMQILVEGLALAAFQQIRDGAQNPLAASVNAYVMQDEARHVAFGRLALRDYDLFPGCGEQSLLLVEMDGRPAEARLPDQVTHAVAGLAGRVGLGLRDGFRVHSISLHYTL